MAYTPQTWINGTSKLNAARMTVIENGIADIHNLVDAKGDLYTATAADTPARLAVGANDKLLVADSAQATGLKWANITNAMVDAAAAIAQSKIAVPSAKVAATAHNAAHNVASNVVWATESWDTDTMVDLVSQSTRITIKTAGKYLVSMWLEYASNASAFRSFSIFVNGVARRQFYLAALNGVSTTGTMALVIDLAVNDYLTTEVYQASGSDLAVAGEMTATRVAT